MKEQNNSTTAYEAILMDVYLGRAFNEAVDLLKSKKATARQITFQFLQLFEANQYSNPDFVLELHELLTDTKQRRYLLQGISGK
jgi:hypothetical protein